MFLPALCVSVIGLLLIVYISPSIKPPLSHVSDISPSSLEKVVHFVGNVSKQRVFRGGSMVLTVSEGGSKVDVYLPFDYASAFKGVKMEGNMVEVSGTVQVYEGRLEVVADKAAGVRLR